MNRPEFPATRACIFAVSALAISFPSWADLSLDPDPNPNPQFVDYDSKTYPGVHCEAQSTAQQADFSNIGFDMVNASSGKRSVVCPIVRDNTANTDGTVSVRINVANVANKELACTLYSASKFGVTLDSYQASTTAAGDQTLYLDVNVSEAGGFYGINCSLPSNAAIRSYESREYLETDSNS